MIVYRLSLLRYADSLDGTGARIAGGRWNEKNVPVLYASESRALATLELLVHVPLVQLSAEHAFRTFKLPKNAKTESVLPADLPSNWREPSAMPTLAAIGSRWVESRRTLALRVPSVIIPEESNVLLNPLHPDFERLEISKPVLFTFDRRLLHKR